MSDGHFRLGAVCSGITAKILTTDFVLNGVHPITGFTNEAQRTMADKCPMDDTKLDAKMICATCGREWYWSDIGGEKCLTSKKRQVKIMAPLVEGARLDDCIKPVR